MGCRDIGAQLYSSAQNIYQNYVGWTAQGINISDTLAGGHVFNNVETFYTGFRGVIDELLHETIDETGTMNNLQLAFLLVEGCVVCIAGAA